MPVNNLKTLSNVKCNKNVSFSAESMNHWHKRFLHVNFEHIKSTSRNNCVRKATKFKRSYRCV